MSDEGKYLFVDEQLRYTTGEEAARALATRSDAPFFTEGEGVLRVPKTRWQEAQHYERDTWLIANATAADDRNNDHERAFGGYEALAGRRFAHAIELGCGPFTNLRVIARHCTVSQCSLLDPLIEDYLLHPHCMYDRRFLTTGETTLARTLRTSSYPGRAIGRLLRAVAPDVMVHRVPVAELLPIPIEELSQTGRYDLVVMINVIEHCFDVTAIFEKILQILQPGGTLVFHDKLFDVAEVEEDVKRRFDAGHPLRVGRPVIESFLSEHFDESYRRIAPVEDHFEDIDLTREGIYFVGTKRRGEA